ncbi:helix-hairpin-helix domain-containing protein [Halobaculum sp. MBLA0147]|uniref:helix-hairpin-helix domain-containing protein n=1 Tax=Halobaculum sp. MBLA0147 TaxID=3079934 RepID=UPI003524B07E
MELTSIPGVGEKTADALAELDDAEAALRNGDVARIARAPGISEGRAAVIARGAIRARHDDPGGWAATDRAKEVHDEALALVRDRAVTDYARKRLATLYPSAVPERIAEVRAWAARAMRREPDPDVLAALEGVEPLAEPEQLRVRDRALATADAERFAEADTAFPELPVEVVEDAGDLAELARSYPTVIVLDETFAGVDVEGDVRVLTDAEDRPAEVVPERLLAFVAENRERLRAALDVHEAAGSEPALDPETLRDVLARVDADGEIVGDEELDRLATAVDDLDAAASTAASVANDHLRTVIRERDVTIEGQDFLSLVEQGARVDSLLARELADEYDEAVRQAREQFVDALALDTGEAEIAERVFGGEPTFPVEHNEDPLARLRTELKTARDRRAARLKSDLADEIAALRDDAERLVADALELDVELAVARFAEDFDCVLPSFVDDAIPDDPQARAPTDEGDTPVAADGDGGVATPGVGPGATSEVDAEGGGGAAPASGPTAEPVAADVLDGDGPPDLAIQGGKSPLIDEAFADVEPVDYGVSGVTILSGVNSGGKTSTLDLVALVATLAHTGLPVPAQAVTLRRVSGLHYYAKSQGTLDAGAFESTLREFGELATGADGRLVLVDELESITEPGASAKIIAGILERLDEQGATAVFVSHMAREIAETAAFDVAIDGIEAIGLEDGELVVDRSPKKDHLARSTPELIVEKLSDAADGGEGAFYGSLLEKF